MISKRKKVYSDDLLSITNSFKEKLEEIEKKLGNDFLINQGLFLMVTAYFEDSIRELMKIVLVAFPEKLTKDSCTISREQICAVADKGHSIIIENELYFIFKGGVRTQLEKLLKILFNKEYRNGGKISNKNSISKEEKESIIKLEEISLYRNALIHNGGKVSIEMNEKVKYFKPPTDGDLVFDSKLIRLFIKEYVKFFKYLTSEINNTFSSYQHLSVIEKTEILWKDCFSSPILQFKDYWDIDNERDLITGIKHPEIESSISSSEKVLLSIWRHQFDDSIRTEEFLLCSVNYHKIYELYKGLDNLKFYHMKQKSERNNWT
ncbi:hypothetical protein RDV77_03015 [Porphyromonadaceae sp. NP-X]|nr:hypothetical protein [Porphyromonadaceae sp. NP-X]